MASLRSLNLVERTAVLALRAWGFRSTWIDTTHGPVHVLVREARRPGPPIVLMHGLVASGADYFPMLSRLARRGYGLVAPDLPGHGLSPVPERGMRPTVLLGALDEALQQVIREPSVIFGNSMGGFAAVRIASTRPELTAGLFLASPGGAPLPEPAFSRFLERFRIQSQADARKFVHDMQGSPSIVPAFVAWGVRERFSRPAIRELIAGIEPHELLTSEELQGLAMPVTVLWGRKERILPPTQREFFRWNLPEHAVFEEPPHLGHAPFLDDPTFVVRRLERFVAECGPEPVHTAITTTRLRLPWSFLRPRS